MKENEVQEVKFQFYLGGVLILIESQQQYNAYKDFVNNENYIFIRIGDICISKVINPVCPSNKGSISFIVYDSVNKITSKLIKSSKQELLNYTVFGLPDKIGGFTLMDKNRYFIIHAKDQYKNDLVIKYFIVMGGISSIEIYKDDQKIDAGISYKEVILPNIVYDVLGEQFKKFRVIALEKEQHPYFQVDGAIYMNYNIDTCNEDKNKEDVNNA